MQTERILIVSCSSDDGTMDPHANEIAACVQARGLCVDILDTSRPSASNAVFLAGRDATIQAMVVVEGRERPLDHYAVIWVRRVDGRPRTVASADDLTRAYQARVWAPFVRDALMTARGPVLINAPSATATAEHKGVQLHMATTVGLAIPSTLITADPAAARTFVAEPGQYIYKSLSQVVERPDLDPLFFMTERISVDDIDRDPMAYAQAPVIYQRYVDKDREYRAFVVGNRVDAASIVAAPGTADSLDWRHYNTTTRWDPARLPATIERQLVMLVQRLGLHSASIDLIEERDTHRIVFVEANPSGNFLFLADLAGLDVAEAFAAYLVAHASKRVPHSW